MVDFAVTVVGAPTVARAAELQRDVLTAAALWGAHLVGHASLEILVTVRPLEGAVIAQASSTQAFAEVPGVYQFGTVLELRSGEDPNGIGTDIWIEVDLAKLDRTDPIEVFTHELGHAFSFNGWGIGAQLQSSFDAEVRASASGPLFHGSAAMAIAGGPVPLAPESPLHYAQGGLMNPYNTPGRRHQIDALDIAFLSDSGVPVRERFGTLGNDSLALTPGDDVVYAGFGADVVFGNQGDDTLYGGAGADTVFGGRGHDLLFAGEGDDVLLDGPGDDTLAGGPGSDLFVFGDDAGTNHISDWQFDIGEPGRGDRLQFASEPQVSVDYASYAVTYRAGRTTVILDHVITILPGWVTVA